MTSLKTDVGDTGSVRKKKRKTLEREYFENIIKKENTRKDHKGGDPDWPPKTLDEAIKFVVDWYGEDNGTPENGEVLLGMVNVTNVEDGSHLTGVPPTMIYDDTDIQGDLTLGGTSVIRVREVYKKWLHLVNSDIEFIDVGLVCVLDRDLPGDPLWMFLIAPSGGMKSEIVRSISKYPRAYTLDKLTPQTFVSGKIVTVPGTKTEDNPEGEKRPAGILQYIDGKVLVLKDFTVILGMRKENRYEIFAQLRSVYDGYLEMAFGTMHHPVRVRATIGFVAGVTPAIDNHIKVTTTLGERFLKIRQHPESITTTRRSQQNLGHEEVMRYQMSGVVKSFLIGLKFDKLAEFSTSQEEELVLLANYVAVMRVWVDVETWQGNVVTIYPVEPEVPTRVVKQLKKLGIGLALVRNHTEVTDEDMDTLRRVARDTCVPMRQKIIEQFIANPNQSFTHTQLKKGTDYHYNSIRIECEKMIQVGILNRTDEETTDNQGRFLKTVTYLSLTDSFKPLLAAVRYTSERPIQELELKQFDISNEKKHKFPRLKRDRAKAILRLFVSEGQTISSIDIQKQLADIYGSGFEDKIAEAIMGLMQEGVLFESKPGVYRRAA